MLFGYLSFMQYFLTKLSPIMSGFIISWTRALQQKVSNFNQIFPILYSSEILVDDFVDVIESSEVGMVL